ncbi:MAG: hypothetical protein JNK65_09510 [Deltaproteobacteria bacterium]|nr:hypothetical protein [Deltaproteobacteria bacterium]
MKPQLILSSEFFYDPSNENPAQVEDVLLQMSYGNSSSVCEISEAFSFYLSSTHTFDFRPFSGYNLGIQFRRDAQEFWDVSKATSVEKSSSFDTFLHSIFSFLPTGCSSTPGAKAPSHESHSKELKLGEIMSDGNLELRLEMEGDVRTGKLLMLRQNPIAGDFFTFENLTGAQIHEMGEREEKLFLLLEEMKVRHVFEEGRVVDLVPGNREALILRAEKILAAKGLQIRSSDSAVQKRAKTLMALALFGAPMFYALQHPEVHLHKTLTDEEFKSNHAFKEEFLKKHSGKWISVFQDSDYQKRVEVPKEIWAVRELNRFYQKYPGSTPAIVFGRDHRFCDKLQKTDTHPKIISTWWKDEGRGSEGLPKVCR